MDIPPRHEPEIRAMTRSSPGTGGLLPRHARPPEPLLEELAAYTRAHCKSPQMLTGPSKAPVPAMLVQITGTRRVLEIGTYTGYRH